MRVADVYSDCKTFIGSTDATTIFWYISEAIAILSSKGSWDATKVYLDLPVQSSNLVTLPEFVDVPLKAVIGGNPSFSRDRMYEFAMNGLGTTGTRTTFGWEDRGFVPTLIPLPSHSRLLITGSAADAGLKVVIKGRDSSENNIEETLTIATADVASTADFYKITEVGKDRTTNSISLYATANGTTHTTLLSTYGPNETNPNYRQIRLSDSGETVRLLVRRKTHKVYSQDDFIPVQSKIGLLLMVKALVAFQRTDSATGRAYEEDAVRLTTDAQKATTAFIDLAKETEADSPRGYSLSNRDSVIVSDVYDDVAEICGPYGETHVYDKITDSLEALSNKGHWDGLTGYVDILTSRDQQLVTLPRYVESPIEVNLGRRPATMRNKWFEFHINGPGSDCIGNTAWEWQGDVPTQNPINYITQIVLIPDDNADDDQTVTIYGLDENNKPLMTDGVMGYVATVDHTKLLPESGDQKITRIDRVIRDNTVGFVRMIGYSIDQTQSAQLGYFYPDETEPQYIRIRIPVGIEWIRLRYRKRTLKVTSPGEPLHLKSKLAIVTMARALKLLEDGEPEKSVMMQGTAVSFLEEEQSSRNPSETFSFKIDPVCFGGSNYIMS